MHTQKIAITIPINLVATIDEISKEKGLSRSRYISLLLKETIAAKKQKQIREAYDRIFSDKTIQQEQLNWTQWFNDGASEEGQEW